MLREDMAWSSSASAGPVSAPPGAAGTRASRPTSVGGPRDELAAEVDRLRKVCERRELALERLLEATLALRRGSLALREENRELRIELQRLRRRRG